MGSGLEPLNLSGFRHFASSSQESPSLRPRPPPHSHPTVNWFHQPKDHGKSDPVKFQHPWPRPCAYNVPSEGIQLLPQPAPLVQLTACVCARVCTRARLDAVSPTDSLRDPSLSGSPFPICKPGVREVGVGSRVRASRWDAPGTRGSEDSRTMSACSDQVSWRRGFECVAFGEAREGMEGAPGMGVGMSKGLVCGKKRRKAHVASS